MKRAVLFDWRGTLVVAPGFEDWVRDGLLRCGREAVPALVDELVARIVESNGPADRLDTPGIDTDPAFHRSVSLGVLADAGIDDELAEAIYSSESDWRQNPFAVDAASTIRALADGGILVGVVSDIHFDIRPAFDALGIGDLIAAYVLSFEVGAQKPSAAMFDHALASLDLTPQDALFVGDRSGPDGGAVEHGIMTLLLPPLATPTDSRLSAVTLIVLPDTVDPRA
ncbi:HAD hydrolase-like protein [Streptomyces sp. G2]|uniref:HAD family hydrolase n=1 Tax=Streptomyces sp. G2 TaxID=1684471 RepID=UPI0020303268|nr:HAD family hydrolase [Streptomyces sp. G2]MCM1951421.1 HAD hydrolase-like protein [Streptomyces sp. G2]